MMMMMCWSDLMVVTGVLLLLFKLMQVYETVWKKPKRIRSTLSKQGIGGPTPAFLYGNVKEIQKMESAESVLMVNSKSEDEDEDGKKTIQAISHHHWVRSTFPYLQRWTFDYGNITNPISYLSRIYDRFLMLALQI